MDKISMEQKIVEYRNKGMYQDIAISKASDEFAFENLNIRITANEDNTLLAVTNEKGPSVIEFTPVYSNRVLNRVSIKTEVKTPTRVNAPRKQLKIYCELEHVATSKVTVQAQEQDNPTKVFATIKEGEKKATILTMPFTGHIPTFEYSVFEDTRYDDNYIYLLEGEDISDIETEFIKSSTDYILGTYLGKAQLNNTLVLFTHGDTEDYIYKISKVENSLTLQLLYEGSLGFNVNYPIDAIADYESEDIQKVYWVDGLNPNRVINVSKSAKYGTNNSQFDFVPIVNSYPSVSIEKQFNGSGEFKAGIIQYYFCYYRKFGAQSAIVYASPLNYIAFQDRGGKEGETISLNFKLTISDLDVSFDYVKIYSAKRTSLDGPLEVNLVGNYQIPEGGEIQVTDTNYNQEAVDPSILSYLAGDSFTATTLAKKEDTLFLGNIKLTDENLSSSEKETIQAAFQGTQDEIIPCKAIIFDYKAVGKNNDGEYNITLENTSSTIKGFKRGEIYRFGIQFQTIKGNWTSVVWIGDKECNLAPKEENGITYIPNASLTVSSIFQQSDIQSIISKYINYRLVMAQTSVETRKILAQGIVNPTMFNYKERANNTVFSIPSYITRPQNGQIHWQHMDCVGANNEDFAEIQCISEIRPPCIEAISFVDGTGSDSNNYIPNGYLMQIDYIYHSDGGTAFSIVFAGGIPLIMYTWKVIIAVVPAYAYEQNGQTYYKYDNSLVKQQSYTTGITNKAANFNRVDKFLFDNSDGYLSLENLGIVYNNESIFTLGYGFNGLETIFPSTLVPQYDNNGGHDRNYAWRFIKTVTNEESLVGIPSTDLVKNHQFYIDSNLVTLHSPEIYYDKVNGNNLELKVKLVGVTNVLSVKNKVYMEASQGKAGAAKQIVETINTNYPVTSGFFYQDALYYSADVVPYKMYLWHKTGSIIGQKQLDETQTEFEYYSVLTNKIMANSTFAGKTCYFDNNDIISYTNATASIIKDTNYQIRQIDSAYGKIYYCSNYDNFIIPDASVPYSVVISAQNITSPLTKLENYNDGVRIKYNTTPHAILSFKNTNSVAIPILPSLNQEILGAWQLKNVYPQYTDNDGNRPEWLTAASYRWGVEEYDYEGAAGGGKCVAVCFLPGYYDYGNNQTWYYSTAALERIKQMYTPESHTDFILLSNSPISGIPMSYWGVLNATSKVVDGQVTYEWFLTQAPKNSYYKQTYYWDGTGDYKGSVGAVAAITLSGYSITLGNHKYYVEDYKDITVSGYDETLPYLYVAELCRDIDYDALYGGYGESALQALNWLPISSPTSFSNNVSLTEGDTYYQRFDCLRVYPTTERDENSVVDIVSFMCETHINLDGRSDVNRNNSQLTAMRPTNFGLRNPVYDQENNLFIYNVLDKKYDLNTFKNQIAWSLPKTPSTDIDTWTQVNLANTLSLDGNYGDITKLVNFNNRVLAFQEKSIAVVNYNERVQISTEQGVPIELANSGKVNGYSYLTTVYGCPNRFTICQSKQGLYFIDDNKKVFVAIAGDGIKEISTVGGMSSWFKNKMNTDKTQNRRYNVFSDTNTNDVYVSIPNTSLVYNEQLQAFTSFMSLYANVSFGVNLEDKFYYMDRYNIFYEMFGGAYEDEYSMTYRVNPEPMTDKTFTNVEYTTDVIDLASTLDDSPSLIFPSVPFTDIAAWNEYQKGEDSLNNGIQRIDNVKQRYRIWRADIPRDDTNKRDRMRNPWIYLKLSHIGENIKTIFHNLVVKYFK